MESFQLKNSLLDEINQVRTQPRPAADRIHEALAHLYKEDELHCFKKTIETLEGVDALDDLCSYLRRSNAVDGLSQSDILNRVAQRIAEEKGVNSRTDHERPQLIYERISAQAQVSGCLGELIALRCQTGEEVSTFFLIDDGLATRKRRRMLLDPRYRFIGVGTAEHRMYETIVVVLLAEDISELRASQFQPEVIDLRDNREVVDNQYGSVDTRYNGENRIYTSDVRDFGDNRRLINTRDVNNINMSEVRDRERERGNGREMRDMGHSVRNSNVSGMTPVYRLRNDTRPI